MKVLGSSIYWGRVTHARYLPREHRFAYHVMMFHLFLDELDEVASRFAPLRLEGRVGRRWAPRRWTHSWPGRFTVRRSDFLPAYPGSLDQAARAAHRELTGDEAPGRIAMLANLRSLGWNFNPITLFFYYDGDRVVRCIAEVTNTPWHERHLYLLGAPGPSTFAKAHHVSPFLAMEGTYRLTYRAPLEQFALAMVLYDPPNGPTMPQGPRRFTATMSLEREALTTAALRRAAWRHPDAALRVTGRIYLQAAQLFAKRVRYVPHPRTRVNGVDVVNS